MIDSTGLSENYQNYLFPPKSVLECIKLVRFIGVSICLLAPMTKPVEVSRYMLQKQTLLGVSYVQGQKSKVKVTRLKMWFHEWGGVPTLRRFHALHHNILLWWAIIYLSMFIPVRPGDKSTSEQVKSSPLSAIAKYQRSNESSIMGVGTLCTTYHTFSASDSLYTALLTDPV